MNNAPSKSAVANSTQGSKANVPEPPKSRPKPPQDEIIDEFDFSYIPDELKDLICGPEAVGGGEFGDDSNSGGGQAGPGGFAGATAANAKEQWKQKQMRRRRREDGEDDEEEDEGSEEDEDGEDEDYWDLSDSEEEEEEESSEYSEPSEDFPLPGKDSDDEESDDEDRKERRFVLGTHSFLELRDPGLEDALLPKEELPITETKTGKRLIQQQYADICKELGVLPLRKFLNQMRTDTVDLNRYYLTPSDIIAICKMMENNTKVKYLNLSGNPAGLEGGLAIAKMIENNYTITHLAIAATEIKPAFKKICAAVELNIALESIDLSKNELTDTDMQFVRNFLKETSTLKELYLSRNHIQDQGANYIGTGLLENQSLEVLDLGINEMYGEKKATALFGGIAEHPTMKSLNLLNNTLRDAAGNGIRRVFNKNKQMEFLDTRYNVLGNPGAKAIGGGMRKGLAMEEYLAGPNDWRQDAAASILLPFTNEKTSPEMKTIDFGWLFDVYSQFLKAEARVLKARPDLKIIRGNPFGQWKAKGPDAKALVIRHARVVCENFGTPIEMLIDELRTEPKKLNHKEFKKFIKSCNLYKDKALTDSFIETFKASPFEVDCEGIIVAFDKEYPRVQATAAHSHGEAQGEDEEAMLSKEMKRERDKSIHLMQW